MWEIQSGRETNEISIPHVIISGIKKSEALHNDVRGEHTALRKNSEAGRQNWKKP